MVAKRSVRLRYAVPVVIAAAIAIGAAIPSLSSAASPPQLPQITLQALIAKAEAPQVGAWQGDIRWSADLGLPDISNLSGLTGGSGSGDFDWTSLVSGTHDLQAWSDGDGLRLALPGSDSEIDLYSSGGSSWVYDSVSNTATHLVAKAPAPGAQTSTPSALTPQGLTPQSLGQQILRSAESLTDAAFEPSATIAGQPAYVVALTPRPGSPGASTTTFGRLTVAVDADNGAVLRVAVYPAGSSAPALQVGFHSVHFLALGRHLPASDFAFSPGPGVKVTTRTVGGSHPGTANRPADHPGTQSGGDPPTVLGTGWSQVVVLRHLAGHLDSPPTAPGSPPGNLSPPAPAPAPGSAPRFGRHHRAPKTLASQLDSVTTAVSGPWGTGRLLSSSLLNVLILPDGDVVAGFVTPPVLEAAAANAG